MTGEPQQLACVEIGGGSVQTVLFSNGGHETIDGAHQPPDAVLGIASPGVIEAGLVSHASNLGWRNVDPVTQFGLAGPALVVLNDAEAAALGEVALRNHPGPLVYVCVGTGIGGAVVRDGAVVRSNLFGHNIAGHGSSFGDEECKCGRRGCLETVAAGWALPTPLSKDDLAMVARRIAYAVEQLEIAARGMIVVGGGLTRRYPTLVGLICELLPHRTVEGSAAPAETKSAAPWGLRESLLQKTAKGPRTED